MWGLDWKSINSTKQFGENTFTILTHQTYKYDLSPSFKSSLMSLQKIYNLTLEVLYIFA